MAGRSLAGEEKGGRMTATPKRIGLIAPVAALALAASGVGLAAGGGTVRLSAKMDAHQVVPKAPKGDVAHASGGFVGTLVEDGTKWELKWRVTYSRLDNPKIVIADIHYGKSGKFGPLLVRLCGPCRSGQHGVKKVKTIYVPLIKSGNSFITLITGKNPNGEVRGQIKVG